MPMKIDADEDIYRQGLIVSHYRIVEKIGAGGMGRSISPRMQLNRRVALKFANKHVPMPISVRDLLVKPKVPNDHPHIVTIRSWRMGESAVLPCNILMERRSNIIAG
jgi:hypothetical protein